jgi:hypothetical protein
MASTGAGMTDRAGLNLAEIAIAIGCAARAEEIERALAGPALAALTRARIEQIGKHGHDAEHDSMLPIDQLPRLALGRIAHALDQIRATGEKRQLRAACLNLARGAALALAAIERLAAPIAQSKEGEE